MSIASHSGIVGDVADPFATADSISRAQDEDPCRITGGRYRLPDLTVHHRPDGTRWLETHGLAARKGGRQRVTTCVKNIGDSVALDLWHQRMLLYGLAKQHDLFDLLCATVSTLDGEGQEQELKDALQELAKRVLLAAGADGGANLGTAFHGFTEAQDLGLMHYARRVWHGKLANYAFGLDAQGLIVEQGFVERVVVVERYGLAGTLDRVLFDRIAGVHRIGDLKSQKKFWTWIEIAAQLAAYAMADAMWDRRRMCFVDVPEIAQDEAVVAWMPVEHPDESADGVDFFRVDLEKGRRALDLCIEVGKLRSEAKSVHQQWGTLRPAPAMAAVEAYARRLESVGSLAEGSAVWAEVQKAGLSMDPVLLPLAQDLANRFITS